MKHMLKNKNFFFVFRFYHGQLVSIGIVYVFCVVIIKRVYRLRNDEKFVELYFRLSYSSKTKTFCKCICGTYLHTFDFKILTYIILFMYVKIMQIKRKNPEKSLSYIHTNTQ